jgi:DNA invertase Pin-like site-specific DNA recombinase
MYYGLLNKNFDQEISKNSIKNFAKEHLFKVKTFLREDYLETVKVGDVLLVPNLSYFGSNIFKSFACCAALGEKNISIIFIDQLELSMVDTSFKPMLSIFKALLKSERNFISLRSKAGMSAAKANGTKLGRPKGSSNKLQMLDNYKHEIMGYVKNGVSIASIMKIINASLGETVSYFTFRNYVGGLKED